MVFKKMYNINIYPLIIDKVISLWSAIRLRTRKVVNFCLKKINKEGLDKTTNLAFAEVWSVFQCYHLLRELMETQRILKLLNISGNFQVIENLRETQGSLRFKKSQEKIFWI